MSEDCGCSIILEDVIDNGMDGHTDIYGIDHCPKHAMVDELIAVVRYYAETDRGDVAIDTLEKLGLAEPKECVE